MNGAPPSADKALCPVATTVSVETGTDSGKKMTGVQEMDMRRDVGRIYRFPDSHRKLVFDSISKTADTDAQIPGVLRNYQTSFHWIGDLS